MAVCRRMDFFRGIGGGGGGGGAEASEEMETEAVTDLASRRACFSLMKKFTKEVYCRGSVCMSSVLGVHRSPLSQTQTSNNVRIYSVVIVIVYLMCVCLHKCAH